MRIVHVETILSCGSYATAKHWKRTRNSIHAAIKRCSWPPGSGKFTIFPQSGKKRGEGNGVGPIKNEFLAELRKLEWSTEGVAKNQSGQPLGDFDAVCLGPEGPIVVEWETGNISSSHRSMNKLTMLELERVIASWSRWCLNPCVSNLNGGQRPRIDGRGVDGGAHAML